MNSSPEQSRSVLINTYIINIISGLGYGSALAGLPVEILRQYSKLTNFDPENPTIVSTMEIGLCAGAAVGCILTPIITKKLKLVKSLRVMLLLNIVSACACAVPVHWMYLAAMRFLVGFFTFSISSVSPLLVAEVMTPKQRGIALIVFTIMLNSGVITGYLVHLAISYNYSFWFFQFSTTVVFSTVGITCAQNLVKLDLRNTDSASEVSVQTQITNATKLTKYQLTRLVTATTAIAALQVITGIDAYIIYSSHILEMLFDSKRAGIYGSLIFGVSIVSAAAAAAGFVEKYKRRTMMMIGSLGCAGCDVCMGLCSVLKGPLWLNLLLMIVFLVFYNLGPEAVMYLMFSEMFPEMYKITMNGYAYCVNWSVNIVTVFVFDFFVGGREYVVYFFYAVCTLVTGISGSLMVPETMGRTLNDIEQEIRRWKSKKERLATEQHAQMVPAVGTDMLMGDVSSMQ